MPNGLTTRRSALLPAVIFCLGGASYAVADEASDTPESLVIESPVPLISTWDIYYDDPVGTVQPTSLISPSGQVTALISDFPDGEYSVSFGEMGGCEGECVYESAEWQVGGVHFPHFTIRLSSFRPLPETILDPAIVIVPGEGFVDDPDAFIIMANHREYRLMRWIDRENVIFETVQPVCVSDSGAELIAPGSQRLFGPWQLSSYCNVTSRDALFAVIRASLDAHTLGQGAFIWRFEAAE